MMIAMSGWRVEVVKGTELDATSIENWETLRRRNPFLRSPFFASEYTRTIAAGDPAVEVGVLLREGREVGYFPFERVGGQAFPVGDCITDFQGMVVDADELISPSEYLRGCRLSEWKFRYLATGWSGLDGYRYRRIASPVIGMARGIASFEETLAARGSDLVAKCTRGLRTLTKKAGPVRMELDSRSPLVLETILKWKAAQHERNQTRDNFSTPRGRDILDRLAQLHDPTLAGVIPGLYAGDDLVAAAYCLRSHETLHVWITAYNPDFSKFSPGLLCMMELVRHAAADGVTRIDLGHGDEPYKYRFATEIDEVAEGAVTRGAIAGWARHCVYRARQKLLDSRWRPLLQRLKLTTRQWRQMLYGGTDKPPIAAPSTEERQGE